MSSLAVGLLGILSGSDPDRESEKGSRLAQLDNFVLKWADVDIGFPLPFVFGFFVRLFFHFDAVQSGRPPDWKQYLQ